VRRAQLDDLSPPIDASIVKTDISPFLSLELEVTEAALLRPISKKV
jgi:hypothetical protein